MKHPKFLWQKILSGSLLIAGTTVGAGMLGIPLVTFQAGFIPAMMVTLSVWIFMMLTGYLLTKVALKCPEGASFLTITQDYLGKHYRWVVGLLFLFLYYCLMVAYFAAGAPFLNFALEWLFGVSMGIWTQNLLFALIFGTIVIKGSHSVDRFNTILTFLMILVFILLLLEGGGSVQKTFLLRSNKANFWIAFPILFSAFGFHNVIPSLVTYLQKDKKALIASLILGTTIPFAMYALWQWLILGSLEASSLQEALKLGHPATFALADAIQSNRIYPIGQWFAFLALITSLLGVSLSLIDFFKDGLSLYKLSRHRLLLGILTFFPPFILASTNPSIFAKALGVAGGFGEALLNGFLPTLLAWQFYKKFSLLFLSKKCLFILLSFISLVVVFIECLNLLKTTL